MRTTVIGGGITGLSIAYELAKKGERVAVFERAERVGGLASSFRLDSAWLECFYHHIFKSDGAIRGWIDELGLGGRLIWRPSSIGFFHSGRIHRFGTPLELLRFSPLSIKDRIRLGMAILRFQRMKEWEELDGITCADWFSGRVSRAGYKAVWEPLLRLKFGEAHGLIPAAWIWGRIHPRARSRSRGGMREELGYLEGGFELMIRRLRDEIKSLGGDIFEGAAVEYIIQENGSVRGVVADGQEFFCDEVVSTIPLPEFLSIAPPLPDSYRKKLEAIRYQSVVCLVMTCRKSVSPVYWLNIGDPGITFGGLIEHTNFVSPENYGGRKIIYIFNYVGRDDPLLRMSKEEYFSFHEGSLRRINPSFNRDWVEGMRIFRAAYGTVIYTLGYRDAMPSHKTPVEGLYLVNTSQIYPYDRNMNNCAALGQRFVQSLR